MRRSTFALGLLTLAAAANLSAGTLVFTDRANWAAQVNILSNFSGTTITPGSYLSYSTPAGLVLTDLQMSLIGTSVNGGTTYSLEQVNASAAQPWFDWGSGTILRSGDKTANNTVKIQVNFTTPVNAFGLNFGGSGTDPSHITIAPVGYTSVDVTTLGRPNWNFFGLASNTQTFSTVDIYINDTNKYLVLDDIARADFVETPPPPPPVETAEPGTLLQLMMGSGLLAFARRRFSGSSEGDS